MWKSLLAATAIVAVLSSPAIAGQCPADMAKIDAALAKNPELSQAQMTRVKALRTQGEQQHKAGQHAASVRSLAQAKRILKIK